MSITNKGTSIFLIIIDRESSKLLLCCACLCTLNCERDIATGSLIQLSSWISFHISILT